MSTDSSIIAPIPTAIDLTQDWLTNYWGESIGISKPRLYQAVERVGRDANKVRRFVNDSVTIALQDSDGVLRRVAKIMPMKDGVAVSVPYHPAKQGFVFEKPMPYESTDGVIPISEFKQYKVNDTVKLSMHIDGGFVQFSKGGKKPIVSGCNTELGEIKGAGLRAPDSIMVTSGPLFGVLIRGLKDYPPVNRKISEPFLVDDYWHHPRYRTANREDFNIEVFMLPRSVLQRTRCDSGKMLFLSELPFLGLLDFRFTLRILEFPSAKYVFGIIVHPMEKAENWPTGYSLGGPGVGEPGKPKRGLGAMYPRPENFPEDEMVSLDFLGTSERLPADLHR